MANSSADRSESYVSSVMASIAKLVATIILVYLLLALMIFFLESGDDGASIKSFPQALWYTLVTLSTVGYGDIYPVTTLGKIAGGLTILSSVGLIGYTVGKLGDQIIENNRRKFLGMNGTNFKNHYVIVGWNELSRIVANEILSAGFKAALLTDQEENINEIRSIIADDNFFVAFGLYENDAAYQRLNIEDAAGVILLCDDDARTLIIVLHLREMAPNLKITAYIQNSQLRRTVENAGVNYVVSPNEVMGRMIASATFEPDVSTFLEDILSTTTSHDDLDIQEYQLPPEHDLVGRTFQEASLMITEKTGSRLITYSRRGAGGKWEVSKNLNGGQQLQGDDFLIVMVNSEASSQLEDYLGVRQGRRI